MDAQHNEQNSFSRSIRTNENIWFLDAVPNCTISVPFCHAQPRGPTGFGLQYVMSASQKGTLGLLCDSGLPPCIQGKLLSRIVRGSAGESCCCQRCKFETVGVASIASIARQRGFVYLTIATSHDCQITNDNRIMPGLNRNWIFVTYGICSKTIYMNVSHQPCLTKMQKDATVSHEQINSSTSSSLQVHIPHPFFTPLTTFPPSPAHLSTKTNYPLHDARGHETPQFPPQPHPS